MPSKKSLKPEFYKYFLQPGIIPDANKLIKFQESFNYWIFKSGKKVYKVKKKDDSGAVSLDELFCGEIVSQIQRHSPGLEPEIVRLKKTDGDFVLDANNSIAAETSYYVVLMNQLPDRYFLSNIILKNRLNKKHIRQISGFLSSHHSQVKSASYEEANAPDIIDTKLRDLFYQMKKHINFTVSQGVIDMAFRPLEKYLTDNKKLLFKRIKGGYIKRTHGCFIPRKINITSKRILALGATHPLKQRFNDITADVADLAVELTRVDQEELARYFVDKYVQLTEDKDIHQLLPIYQALKCLTQGLKHSVEALSFSAEDKRADQHKKTAAKYFEQVVKVAREI